jgi:hypothetical protein
VYENKTVLPLNINTEEGIYEITLLGNTNQSVLDSVTNAKFQPVNATHAGAFTCSVSSDVTANEFLLNCGALIQVDLRISTYLTSKTISFSGISKISSGISKVTGAGIWNDISSAWSSLGTLIFPFAQSGRIIVRRII